MNAPKQATWIVALIVAVIAIGEQYFFDLNLNGNSFNLSDYTFYMMIASVALLAIGSKVKGL